MMHSLIPCLSRADIPPGGSIRVTVTGIIRSTQQGTQHIVQFSARPFWAPNPVVSRAVQVSAVPPVFDADRPTIRYSLRNNCRNVPRESCSTATWDMEGTAQDSQSGLISVTSFPVGVEILTSFIAGTTANVPIAYTASCCRPTVDITATDARGNFLTRHIDAYTDDWLSEAAIAAIVLGVLLFIFIIIVIVLAILLCRKRRSHNFPQSSR